MHTLRAAAAGAAATLATVGGISIVGAQTDFFYDVPQNHWAHPYIRWSFDNYLMTGPGGQERMFYPERPITRAELAQSLQLLYNMIRMETEVPDMRAYELEKELPAVTEEAEERVEELLDEQEDRQMRNAIDANGYESGIFSNSVYGERSMAVPSGRVTAYARLSGSQEVPRVVTSGRGTATLRWTSMGLQYQITVNGLSSAITAAHFHFGGPGEEGAPIESIAFDGDTAIGIWSEITAANWRDVGDGEIYINVHTVRYPDGEIRGQVQLNR